MSALTLNILLFVGLYNITRTLLKHCIWCVTRNRGVRKEVTELHSISRTKTTFLQSLKGLLDTALLNTTSKDSRLVHLY